MRLFIAINFSENTLSRLAGIRDELRGRSARGSFAHAENLHLTLVFIGECDQRQAETVKFAMSEISFKPFFIAVDRIGRFKRDGGDIWWAGVRENAKLLELQGGLAYSLAFSGIGIENRKYKPHITLGREIETPVKPWEIASFGEVINRIDLMKSERINGKLIYTSIAEHNAL